MQDVLNLAEFLRENLPLEVEELYEYTGIFNRNTITSLTFKVNEFTKNLPKAQRKLFYIFIELAQNVGYYSDERVQDGEKTAGVGSCIFYQTKDKIGFMIGNLINNNAFEVLQRKCNIINGMNRESLREFKRQQRNLIPGTNGNAHIGLIMVALTTNSPIKLFRKKIGKELSFFSILVEVEKK